MKKQVITTKTNDGKEHIAFDFAFGKINYILLIAGIIVMGLGYLALVGGGSNNPDVFNDQLFSTRRLIVSPILIVLGLVIEVFAIMIKSKN